VPPNIAVLINGSAATPTNRRAQGDVIADYLRAISFDAKNR
jgi:hypothetical protein